MTVTLANNLEHEGIGNAAYLGPFRQYMNPYTENVLDCLHSIFDIKYFGPGYCNSLSDFKSEIDKYDFVIFDTFSIELEKNITARSPLAGSYSNVTVGALKGFLTEIADILDHVSARKIFIANMDYYATSEKVVERVEALSPFIISMTDRNSTLKYLSHAEELNLTKAIMAKHAQPTNQWFDFVSRRSELIISIPHFMALPEFDFCNTKSKYFKIDIPGIAYQDRRNYVSYLNTTDKFNYYSHHIRYKYFLLINKMNNGLSQTQLMNFRAQFMKRLSQSPAHITTGGPFMVPVRKFYEIPARSSSMICKIFYGASHQGFAEYLNFLPISDYTNRSIYQQLFENREQLYDIQKAGFAHIMKKHSSPARIKQLLSSLKLIQIDKFQGSIWKNGRYTNL